MVLEFLCLQVFEDRLNKGRELSCQTIYQSHLAKYLKMKFGRDPYLERGYI